MNTESNENQHNIPSEELETSQTENQVETQKIVSSPIRFKFLQRSFGAPVFGVVLTILFYLLICIPSFLGVKVLFLEKFTQRGIIPILTVFLFFWALSLLINKILVFRSRQKSLDNSIFSKQDLKSIEGLDSILNKIKNLPNHGKENILFSQIEKMLRRFKITKDSKEVRLQLTEGLETELSKLESSYTLVRVFLWAIPILGFIGTVLGVSGAVSGFAEFLSVAQELEQIKGSLTGVTSGLSEAFDSTFVALLLSVFLMIIMSSVEKNEKDHLQNIEEYCKDNIIEPLTANFPSFGLGNENLGGIIQALSPNLEKWNSEAKKVSESLSNSLQESWKKTSNDWFEAVNRVEEQSKQNLENQKEIAIKLTGELSALKDASVNLFNQFSSFLQTEENTLNEIFVGEKTFLRQAFDEQKQQLERYTLAISETQKIYDKLQDLKSSLERELVQVSGSEGLIATLTQVQKTLQDLNPPIQKLTEKPIDVNIQFVSGGTIVK